MKKKTTQKAIKNNYHTIIKVGYCDVQHLLTYHKPVAYTVRAEGWASDVYDLGGGVALSTGYKSFGNVMVDRDTLKDYEDRARDAADSYEISYNDKVGILVILLEEFLTEEMLQC